MQKNNTYYFISDAHLGAKENQELRIKKIMSFLESINNPNTTLFIVGDLFDFWFEYKHVIPKEYFSVLCMLENLVQNGVKINYITGNHDFWIGDFFKQMGIEIFKDPVNIKVNNKQFYIGHGDGILKNDQGYRLLKKIIRHPINIKLYRLIHPDIGIALAHFFSNLSRNKKTQHNEQEYINFARDKFNHGIDYVILGHTHLPFEFTEKEKKIINIGDWINQFSYGHFKNNKLEIKYWD